LALQLEINRLRGMGVGVSWRGNSFHDAETRFLRYHSKLFQIVPEWEARQAKENNTNRRVRCRQAARGGPVGSLADTTILMPSRVPNNVDKTKINTKNATEGL
jgi:hypothetical protein